jgi:hypothetical protein
VPPASKLHAIAAGRVITRAEVRLGEGLNQY